MEAVTPVIGRFRAPSAERPTRLAVLSDLHLSVEREGSWRVSHKTEDRLRCAVESLNALPDLDGVLFLGDLVDSGVPAEYEALEPILADLKAPLVAVPGNHDMVSLDSISLSAFEERFTPDGLPFRIRIGGVDLLALNSHKDLSHVDDPEELTPVERHRGRLAPESLAWLSDQLETVEEPLVAVHHNLPPTRSMLFDYEDQLTGPVGSPRFENAEDLVDVLEDHGPGLVLTGHVHFPATAPVGTMRELTLPSLGPYPSVFNVLDIDAEGTTVTAHPVCDYEERLESLVLGKDFCRVQIAAAQMSGLPLIDELASSRAASPPSPEVPAADRSAGDRETDRS